MWIYIFCILSPCPILDTSPPQLAHSPLFLDYFLLFLHKTSWEGWLTKKLKWSQMLLVTEHEQIHQVAHTMIRDNKFHADLQYKQRWMSQWTFRNNKTYSTRFLQIKSLLLIWRIFLSHIFSSPLFINKCLLSSF